MPVLKKATKKAPIKEEKIPMFHEGDAVKFDDGEGNIIEGVIETVDNDNETATVLVGEDQYGCGFDELTIVDEPEPAKPAKKTPTKKESAKPEKGKKLDAFAEQFRNTKAAAAGGFLADGDYEGLIVSIDYKEGDKGDSVGIKYTVVNNADEDLNGKSAVSFYNVTDEEGNIAQGLEYLKRDLALLGVDADTQDAVTCKEDFTELLSNLAEEQKWVEFQVKTKKYTNVYLKSVFDNQEDKPLLEE